MNNNYNKSKKYNDLAFVYSQCSGPGGLKVTEYIADRMHLKKGGRLLDIGTFFGLQSCFLAKEYGVFTVGIDPGVWNRPFIEFMMENALKLGVHDKVLGIETGVPNTKLPENSFDYAYSTTTFEMIRGQMGSEGYIECLKEVFRILKPGGIFGLGEPMIKNIEIPIDMKDYIPRDWLSSFVTIEETCTAFIKAGFTIVESGYAGDAQLWWNEYAEYNKFTSDEFEEKKTISLNEDRWLSYGYVIAKI